MVDSSSLGKGVATGAMWIAVALTISEPVATILLGVVAMFATFAIWD
jgi:hypothetical protein